MSKFINHEGYSSQAKCRSRLEPVSRNKSKFMNRKGKPPNYTAKVMRVCGVHRITIWELRDITVGEALVCDYGYK
ncbi:Polycomb protein EZH2 [Phytophthora megakarya]|uniref:Polycomb protein EZH2 n=1 Tax=Phytophthora megakarya TaxID=4795 RepID=A0A225WU98_9STRA|nr:Polycomb protein EZH2 [Phytophthora megakarya]